MFTIKLAIKNLLGAGLRTWLNVAVLSFSFVVIVFHQAILDGWNEQARRDTIQWEVGNGQLWHPEYDRYDQFSLEDAHMQYSDKLKSKAASGKLVPILIRQASIYPKGRMQNVLLKGISPEQNLLFIPSAELNNYEEGEIPAIIGKRMSASSGLKAGDRVLVRWRDKNGTFDAEEISIKAVFNSNVPAVDNGQIWLPLEILQKMTDMESEATLLVCSENYNDGSIEGWHFKDREYLLKEINETIRAKKGGGAVIYILLLAIALLAIFDTQVLSIFRRQKEIGTFIALGMTRFQVIKLFTIEGSAHSILAAALASVYGVPLLYYLSKVGIAMPGAVDNMGVSISEKLIPVYNLGMVAATVLLVVVSATIVSYFPARRISGMKPTEALKGKIQ